MGTAGIRRRVTSEERGELARLASVPLVSGARANRARVVLAVLDGTPPAAIASQTGIPRTTVYSWVRRFAAAGTAALDDRPRRGRRVAQLREGREPQTRLPSRSTMTPDALLQRHQRETLRWLRGRLGLSQLAFAALLAVDLTTVSRWESRHHAISDEHRGRIAALLAPHLTTAEGATWLQTLRQTRLEARDG